MNKHLLLLSSSRVGETAYLEHATAMIDEHLGDVREIVFIPYAGVTINFDEYTQRVQNALAELNINVKGIHTFADPKQAIEQAKAIVVGGGNTFQLLNLLYRNELIELIQQKVSAGTPYIGWSAGSNIAGASIKTTNDMPIVEPQSFNALNLLPVQLNPHYTDFNPPGHNGETREQRLQEFMVVNPDTTIIGIVEGTALQLTKQKLSLIGGAQGYRFINGCKTIVPDQADLSDLL